MKKYHFFCLLVGICTAFSSCAQSDRIAGQHPEPSAKNPGSTLDTSNALSLVTINPRKTWDRGDSLTSPNGLYKLILKNDGNLCLNAQDCTMLLPGSRGFELDERLRPQYLRVSEGNRLLQLFSYLNCAGGSERLLGVSPISGNTLSLSDEGILKFDKTLLYLGEFKPAVSPTRSCRPVGASNIFTRITFKVVNGKKSLLIDNIDTTGRTMPDYIRCGYQTAADNIVCYGKDSSQNKCWNIVYDTNLKQRISVWNSNESATACDAKPYVVSSPGVVSVSSAVDNISAAQRACGMLNLADANSICNNQSQQFCALNYLGKAQRALGSEAPGRFKKYLDQIAIQYDKIADKGCFIQNINDLGVVYNNIISYSQASFLKMVPLDMNGVGGPPFISVEGAAMRSPTRVLFDTGSPTLSLSYTSVSNQVTVLQANITEPFGHPADLVQGQIKIFSKDRKTQYTINDFIFYRTKDNWSIFGAWPVYKTQRIAGGKTKCVAGFFTALDYSPYGRSGYSFISDSDHFPTETLPFPLYLKVGIAPIPSDTLWYQYPDDLSQCEGPGARRPVRADTVPNFTVNFNPKGLPITGGGVANLPYMTFTGLDATIDTGAPDFNIQDDPYDTINFFMDKYLESCPPYPWLSRCRCFMRGYPVEVGFSDSGNKGSYFAEGVAVCKYGEWPFSNSPKRFNAGRSFYYQMNQQMYDLDYGRVGLVFP